MRKKRPNPALFLVSRCEVNRDKKDWTDKLTGEIRPSVGYRGVACEMHTESNRAKNIMSSAARREADGGIVKWYHASAAQ